MGIREISEMDFTDEQWQLCQERVSQGLACIINFNQDQPRYNQPAVQTLVRPPYGSHTAAYLDVSSKRSLLNNLLTYLNLQDQITTLKLESPGIDGYNLCNYTLGSIGITIWIGALIFAIIFNRKERLKLKNT